MDLLIKAQIPPNAIAEVPFSFGVRSEGESKLTGKVMIKYLEQLAELYWHKFSVLVVVFVLLAVIFFLYLVQTWLGSPSTAVDHRH